MDEADEKVIRKRALASLIDGIKKSPDDSRQNFFNVPGNHKPEQTSERGNRKQKIFASQATEEIFDKRNICTEPPIGSSSFPHHYNEKMQ
jgi:hypothetical protein